MTVSYRPTQNPQEPEPQRPGMQQPQSPVAGPQGGSVVDSQQLPPSIRRRVVRKPLENPPDGYEGNVQPGNNYEAKRHDAYSYTASPTALNSGAGGSYQPAPFIQSNMPAQKREVSPAGVGRE